MRLIAGERWRYQFEIEISNGWSRKLFRFLLWNAIDVTRLESVRKLMEISERAVGVEQYLGSAVVKMESLMVGRWSVDYQ